MSEVFNSIQPKVSFTAPPVTPANQTQTTVGEAIAAAPAQDTVQISKPKAEKKGFVKSVNEAIGNFKKFVASAETYTIAGFKGFFKGAVVGSMAFAGGMLINEARKLPSKLAMKGKEVSPEIIKASTEKITKLGKNNKFIGAAAALIGVGTFAGTLWKATLDVNEKKSNIEHRYEGHKQ